MKAKTFFDVDKPSEKLNISNGTLPGINEEASDGEGDNTGFLTAVSSAVKFRKLRKRHLKNNPSIRRFERRYTELGPLLKPEQKRIDYILLYDNKYSKDEEDEVKRKHLEVKESKRERFKNAMKLEGFLLQEEIIRNNVFIKIHCPFKRLCAEAEMVKLEMPIKDCDKKEPNLGCFGQFLEKHFETDNEVDFVSAPFVMDKIQLYEGYEDPTNFFRSSVRSMLVHHILINLDIRDKSDKERKVLQIRENEESPKKSSILPFTLPCFKPEELSEDDIEGDIHLTALGLPYLLMKGVFKDAFPLHEESSKSKFKEERMECFKEGRPDDEEEDLKIDPRRDLDDTWTKLYKFQPLWKIRNYFGEKIALYFAWTGMLTSSLWIPTIFGFCIFLYGLIASQINGSEPLVYPPNATALQEITVKMNGLLSTIKRAFDNDVTPFFALIICLWGTVFLELWKRTNATLAYEWDVDNFETNEPDRPQFYGLKVKTDPITSEENWVYPFKRLILKYTGSTMVVIFMILVVFACVASVILYRVIVSVDVCPGMSAVDCLIRTTVFSSVMNGGIILILGKFYDKLALMLTDWENHRTQSRYDDALIIKVFAFQFANTYASCFYIAFFRGKFEIFGLGGDYYDACSDTCMSQLSFQVMVLMLIKPFPKFLKDIVLPTVRKFWRNRPNWCCRYRYCDFCQCCKNKVTDEEALADEDKKMTFDYVENERLKPVLDDFTLSEYTEKILQYGFLMLFAASFPLAPLLALLTNAIDIRVDAKRMLWMYRRPVAAIRGDIGKWYGILQFVNLVAVVTNGFIIAFTSSWAQDWTTTEKLWLVIGFEHIVFGLKFILAYLIPDVPAAVALDIRREKFQVAKLLGTSTLDKKGKGSHDLVDYSELVPKYSKRRRERSSNYDTFEENDDTSNSLSKKIVKKEKEKNKEKKSDSDVKEPYPSLPTVDLIYKKPEYTIPESLNDSSYTIKSISGIQPTINQDTEV
ncbi:anoctamin-7-like isoform X2 [Mytilus galloprovincialis]|uniref:anoctamin-7-like isoform X2 n=1 Tax=Mytilus galloprovincialis TaxID=29158 RepID=UPI003F7BCBE8